MGAKNSSSCKSFDFLDGGLVVEESLLLELLPRAPSTYLWRKTSFCRSCWYQTKQYLCKSPFAAETHRIWITNVFYRWAVDNREAQHQLKTYVQNIDHDPVFRDLGPKFVSGDRLKLILVLNHRRPFLSTQSRKSFFELDLLRTIFSTLWIHFFE